MEFSVIECGFVGNRRDPFRRLKKTHVIDLGYIDDTYSTLCKSLMNTLNHLKEYIVSHYGVGLWNNTMIDFNEEDGFVATFFTDESEEDYKKRCEIIEMNQNKSEEVLKKLGLGGILNTLSDSARNELLLAIEKYGV